MKEIYAIFEDILWLTQLGLVMLLPLVMCLGGCWWLVNRLGWPMWLYVPAVLLGLAAGGQNFWGFAKQRLRRAQKSSNKRVGFNTHK